MGTRPRPLRYETVFYAADTGERIRRVFGHREEYQTGKTIKMNGQVYFIRATATKRRAEPEASSDVKELRVVLEKVEEGPGQVFLGVELDSDP